MGSPYYFNEAECTNTQYEEQLKNQINQLYENTGKKVIIIGHSYGTLNINYQLNKSEELRKKVEQVIYIAGPLGGASKSDQMITSGSDEIKIISSWLFKVGVEREFQSMTYPFSKSTYSLRNKSINDIFKGEKYNNLKKAIYDRMKFEECQNEALINNQNPNKCEFDKESNNLLNSLLHNTLNDNDLKCKVQDNWDSHKTNFDSLSNDSTKESHPSSYFPCHFNFFDNENCPIVKIKEKENILNKPNETKKKELCNNNDKFNSYYLCSDDQKNESDNCLNDFILKYGNFANKYGHISHLNQSEIYNHMDEVIKNLDNICGPDINVADVNTIFIFNKSFETKMAFLYSLEDYSTSQLLPFLSKKDIVFTGGDGSVQSDSVIYPALKALYDKKLGTFKSEINLVDFCSPIKNEYLYSDKSKDLGKIYNYLNFECRQPNGEYDSTNMQVCSHASMHSDYHIISYVKDVILSKKLTDDKINQLEHNFSKYAISTKD